MGWDYCERPAGRLRDFLDARHEWRASDAEGTVEATVLASAVVRFREYYAAVEYRRVTHAGLVTSEVVGVVGLLDLKKETLGVKWLDEFSGPNASRAPRIVLDLLSPLDGRGEFQAQWSAAWRARCRANLERVRLAGRVRVGDVVTLAHEYAGCSAWVVAERYGARVTFRRSTDPVWTSPVGLRKWRDNLQRVERAGVLL